MVKTINESFYKCSFVFLVMVVTVLTYSQAQILEFTIEPIDTVVESGHSAVLDCAVKTHTHHQSTVLIQWLDQDRQLLTFSGDSYRSQLTNGSLYINSVTEEQGLTGIYQCKASLPDNGSIVSRSAKLNTASLSGFYEEPRDITVFIGQKAHFPCRVGASPPSRIRWLKDERPFQLDELRMTSLPSGALEIDEVIDSDQGSYRCNASSLNRYKLSNKGVLTVDEDHDRAAQVVAPTFIAEPRGAVVIEGQNVSLDCAANGNPKPNIIWLKNGFPIDMNYLDSRYSLIGSTSSLRITNIQETDADTYQCRAENREDSQDASASIDVQVPPRFLVEPEDVVESQNKDIELKCNVHGKPTPKIQWFKNGEPLTYNEYYQIVNGHNLKIMGLISSDAGLVQCVASNTAGNIQAAASVKVLRIDNKKLKSKFYPKKVLSTDNSPLLNKTQSIAIFSSLKSEKSAKLGNVDFGHVLNRDNSRMEQDSPDITERSHIYDPHSAFTSLKSSESNDRTNNLGDIQTAYSSASPKTFAGYHIQSKTAGDGATIGPPQDLKAPVIKARFIILSWKPPSDNTENIEAYSVYYRQEGSERERIQNTSRSKLEEINIGGLIPGRVYHLRVVAFNNKEAGIPSEELTVTTQAEEHVPSAPMHFEAYATGSKSIHVSWGVPEIPIGVIERYTVYYMETRSSIEHHIETKNLQYDFTNLSEYTEYNIWIVAVNQNGPGAATDEKIIRTFGDIPSEAPFNVTIEPASTSLTVRWQPPPAEHQNGIITGYKIRLKKHGTRKANTVTTLATARMYQFTDLEKETPYQIRLWAINDNGTSPPTEWIDVETYENVLDEGVVPDIPGPLNVLPVSDKLYVTWTPPKNQNIKIRNYILGWGKGIPNVFEHELDEKSRSYTIDRLEPNCEYVLSLRASNQMGEGPPVYQTLRTQDEPPPEPQQPLTPPIGLKAHVLSTTSVVLYWTDTTLSKSQYVRDSRQYMVKYSADKSGRSRFVNVTDLNVMINDLRPNTVYEFAVKLVRGRKESPWSMVVTNTTWDTPPNAAPRDVDVHLLDDQSQLVELTWQPPKTSSGRTTGYIILYTDNKTRNDREWLVQAIKGDKHGSVITDLKPFTEYYFKVQARNSRGYGPFSSIVMFRTGQNVGTIQLIKRQNSDSASVFSGNLLLYIIIGGCLLAVTTITVVVAFLCRRKRETNTSPDRSKKGYQKGTQNIKPPDLWIHHDQMELKNLEKSHSNNDAASSSGAMTLPRSVGNEYDNHENLHSSSLDKRTYVPSYAIANPINSNMSQSSSDSTPSSRPPYPRTQYSMPRAHVTLDTSMSSGLLLDSPYAAHSNSTHLSNYDGAVPYVSQPPPVAHVPPGNAYAPGMSVLAESQGGKRLQGQGHPLKSFTVPAPPPISAPGTPQPKHIVTQPQVTVRPNCSPFKKASSNSSNVSGTPPSRISASHPPPHTSDEVQRLHPSHSTEELNQEMANLEGLMLTLNAITANEFEC